MIQELQKRNSKICNDQNKKKNSINNVKKSVNY